MTETLPASFTKRIFNRAFGFFVALGVLKSHLDRFSSYPAFELVNPR